MSPAVEQSSKGVNVRYIEVDSALYSESVVFRVCHLFTDRGSLSLERADGSRLRVRMEPRPGVDPEQAIREFNNELINERVRADVAAETRQIRELIVAQAFAEADTSRASQSELNPLGR